MLRLRTPKLHTITQDGLHFGFWRVACHIFSSQCPSQILVTSELTAPVGSLICVALDPDDSAAETDPKKRSIHYM